MSCFTRVIWACSRDFLVGLRLRGAARGLRQRADDGSARQLDLERVVPETFGLAQQDIGRLPESPRVGRPSAQRSFGLQIAPRLVGDTAQRKAGVLDGAAFELESGGDRNERERVGEAIANFEISVVR